MDLYKIAASNLKGVGKQRLKQISLKTNGINALFKYDLNYLEKHFKIKKELLISMNIPRAMIIARKQMDFNEKYGVQTLFMEDDNYPDLLKECSDAPITLFYKGHLSLKKRMISIVGTRRASSYGKQNVEKLITSLKGQDIIVISGLAHGIDTFVHDCCVKYQIPTIGVLGHGLDTIYPRSNRNLAKAMLKNGGLLTEYGIDHKISKYCFPKRNRIIAGMSEATIVVESPSKGGAIITAEIANGYNREVMAIPGSVFSDLSKGCNELIKTQKAHLLEETGDLFQLMGWSINSSKVSVKINLTRQESLIVEILQKEKETHFDTLVSKLDLSVSSLHAIILNLELRQIVLALPGSLFKLNHQTFSLGMA
ncbi:MAG: DNA-processing protein DprA [Crocinitomicaceae bacterium]|nr:DNA-processing protein DprA [Crocinitomicaceae bacterium]